MWLLDRAGHWNTGATTGVVTGILVLQQGWSLEYWGYDQTRVVSGILVLQQGWSFEYWCYNWGGQWNTGATTGVVTGTLVLQQGWPLEHWCYDRGGHWNTGATPGWSLEYWCYNKDGHWNTGATTRVWSLEYRSEASLEKKGKKTKMKWDGRNSKPTTSGYTSIC